MIPVAPTIYFLYTITIYVVFVAIGKFDDIPSVTRMRPKFVQYRDSVMSFTSGSTLIGISLTLQPTEAWPYHYMKLMIYFNFSAKKSSTFSQASSLAVCR